MKKLMMLLCAFAAGVAMAVQAAVARASVRGARTAVSAVAAAKAETKSWQPVELKGENVKVEDGKIVITIPVDSQSGFMILQSGDAVICEIRGFRTRIGRMVAKGYDIFPFCQNQKSCHLYPEIFGIIQVDLAARCGSP